MLQSFFLRSLGADPNESPIHRVWGNVCTGEAVGSLQNGQLCCDCNWIINPRPVGQNRQPWNTKQRKSSSVPPIVPRCPEKCIGQKRPRGRQNTGQEAPIRIPARTNASRPTRYRATAGRRETSRRDCPASRRKAASCGTQSRTAGATAAKAAAWTSSCCDLFSFDRLGIGTLPPTKPGQLGELLSSDWHTNRGVSPEVILLALLAAIGNLTTSTAEHRVLGRFLLFLAPATFDSKFVERLQ